MTRFGNKKILIIEDDPDLSRVYKMLLEREGYRQVRYAMTGDKGLVLAKNWRPDLIISDILHREPDGFAIFEELYLYPAMLSARFIIVSGSSVPDNPVYAEKARETGVSVCLEKPVAPVALLLIIYMVLAEVEEETSRGL